MCTLYVRMTADTLRAMSMCTCTPYVCTAPNAILVMLCYAHTLCVCTTADPIHAMPMCTRTPYMYVCTTPIAIHAMPMCTQTPCVQTLHYFITSNSMLCNVCTHSLCVCTAADETHAMHTVHVHRVYKFYIHNFKFNVIINECTHTSHIYMYVHRCKYNLCIASVTYMSDANKMYAAL